MDDIFMDDLWNEVQENIAKYEFQEFVNAGLERLEAFEPSSYMTRKDVFNGYFDTPVSW